jgi:hypothetical protein
MRVAEPHTEKSSPLRTRDLADFTPIVEGIRYVKRDARTLALMFVKCGLGLMGANWVILPLLGARVFPVRLEGLAPAASAVLGMSLLMGSRGIGSLVGPLAGSLLAGPAPHRLRQGILCGFLLAAAGYAWLAVAPTLPLACVAVVLAHAGGSTVWVFSTTLLQGQTEDRFRGRVFSAEFAFHMLSTSTASYLAGLAVDMGVAVRAVALASGVVLLIPLLAGVFLLRLWRTEVPPVAEEPAQQS